MKTLTNHILLYDKDCPLCVWYTGIFVKYKLMHESVRVSFQEIDREKYSNVDYWQAQNKIALINTETQEVIYGIDAITLMLKIPFPLIGILMKFKPIHWFMTQVYSLISLNRKVIIPISCSKLGSCSPARNWFWRIMFILICGLSVNLIVGNYFVNHLSQYFIGNPFYGDSIYFVVQLLFQTLVCLVIGEKNIYDYVGHISIVSFFGALFLGLFGLGLNAMSHSSIHIQMLEPFGYGAVFAWMFMEHRRRMHITEMDWRLTYTWLLIRIIMYPFAFSI